MLRGRIYNINKIKVLECRLGELAGQQVTVDRQDRNERLYGTSRSPSQCPLLVRKYGSSATCPSLDKPHLASGNCPYNVTFQRKRLEVKVTDQRRRIDCTHFKKESSLKSFLENLSGNLTMFAETGHLQSADFPERPRIPSSCFKLRHHNDIPTPKNQ